VKIQHIIHPEDGHFKDDKGRPLEVVKFRCANDCPCREKVLRVTQPGEPSRDGDDGHVYWEFNRDIENPTLNPSVHRLDHNEPPKTLCHLFLRDGVIQCLSDSDSKYAGTNVQLRELEE